MCGRFSLTQPSETVAQTFHLTEVPSLVPRYNIAPSQPVAAVIQTQSEWQLKLLQWGLIPAWAKDPQIGTRMINARTETVSEKPAFRSAFKHRRCLILADGFYEWQRSERRKQPFYFRLQTGEPFAFAGLWEHWQGGETEIVSCTILTTEANELVKPVHDRMPVILDPQDYDRWLNPEVTNPELLQALLQPYQAAAMTAYPVSTQVNNSRNDSPQCLETASN